MDPATEISTTTSAIMAVLVILAAVANLYRVDVFFTFKLGKNQLVLRLSYIIIFVCGVIQWTH